MGRVEYDRLEVGVTSASDANTIFTDISTQTSSADGANVREEGLDKRSLETSIQSVRAFDKVIDASGSTQALTSTYAVVNFGTAMTSGAFNIGSDEVLELEFAMEFISNGSQEGIPAGGDVYVRLVYLPNGGAVTELADSVWRRFVPSAGGRAGTCHCFAILAGSKTLDYVRAEIKDDSGSDVTVLLDSAILFGRLYKEVQ